ncbi:glycoside hydrolase family 30 beta sandwich domain-containing protein [Cytobacillus firmus]|uniref:glycoside hydrolase family 30 beta sandwich domain-containing protein n=1 Tax=Cytobacillus firmus TaxID=1399 RepID=UPI0028F6CAC0|nr:glycoside hydrolase family 30 beta sandwich domain-containing protein [Cytobacillus firmus]
MRFTITAPTIILGISASSFSQEPGELAPKHRITAYWATAFENINGETVAVMINENDSIEEVSLSLGGDSMMLVLPERSIATVIIH